MPLSPRHFIVKEAEIEFARFWLAFLEKHELTMSEVLNILSTEMQSTINLCLKAEREEAKRELRESERRRQEDGS